MTSSSDSVECSVLASPPALLFPLHLTLPGSLSACVLHGAVNGWRCRLPFLYFISNEKIQNTLLWNNVHACVRARLYQIRIASLA